MLYTILPNQRQRYAKLLDAMFLHRALEAHEATGAPLTPIKDPLDHEDTVYLVYYERGHGVLGRARLNPTQNRPTFVEFLGGKTPRPKGKKTWECSDVFFHVPATSTILQPEIADIRHHTNFNVYARIFYEELLEAVEMFAYVNAIDQVLCINDIDEFETMNHYAPFAFHMQRPVELSPRTPKPAATLYAMGTLHFAQAAHPNPAAELERIRQPANTL